MPHIRFTQNLQRHVACPSADLPATGSTTVRAALDHYFSRHERARSYVLDDRGALRRHMVIFLNGRQISDRDTLSDPVRDSDTIDIMQALSGG